jgi:hypothetical protein
MKYIKELVIDENQLDLLLKYPKLYIRFILSYKSKHLIWNVEDKYKNFLIKNTKNIIDNQIISLLIPLTKNNKNLTKDEKNKIKKIILDSNMSFLIFDYADQVLNGPWKEAEKKLILDLDTAFNYVYNLKQSRWRKLEEKLYQNPINAAIYANVILEKPWSESGLDPEIIELIEKNIANNLKATSYYTENVVRRWPRGEKILLTDSDAAINYAARVRGRFPEAEKIIANNRKNAINYAFIVLEKPWSEYTDIDSSISELAEKNISQSAEYSFSYAKKVVEGRWKLGENSILKDKDVLLKYIKEIIKEPWEEGESVISQSASLSYEYAKKLETRFIKGEEKISYSAFNAYIYSKNILKDKWRNIKDIDPKISSRAEKNISNSEYDRLYNPDQF